MKNLLNSLFKTVILCGGIGLLLGVRDGVQHAIASDNLKEAYNDGFEKGLEFEKLKQKESE